MPVPMRAYYRRMGSSADHQAGLVVAEDDSLKGLLW